MSLPFENNDDFTYGNYRGVSEERYIFDGEISWGKSMMKEGKIQIQSESAEILIRRVLVP